MARASFLVAGLVLALSGCGSTTGVVSLSPGVYAVSEMRAPVLGGGAEARRVALAEASGFCGRLGLAAATLATRPDGDPFTPYYPTAFDITFRCLAPGRPGARAATPPVR